MKPIIFNTEDVCATLDNRKMVTRRVIKPQPVHNGSFWELGGAAWSDNISIFHPVPCHSLYNRMTYKPKDILYVRETWTEWNGNYEYKADVDDGYGPFCSSCIRDICTGACNDVLKWHPSIHMPKEAARIFLRVTDVRVEKLQSITMGDMLKEGIIPHHVTGGQWQQWQLDYMKPIWDSTVKPADRALYGWEANPWVWVIEFERISKEEAQQHE